MFCMKVLMRCQVTGEMEELSKDAGRLVLFPDVEVHETDVPFFVALCTCGVAHRVGIDLTDPAWSRAYDELLEMGVPADVATVAPDRYDPDFLDFPPSN